MNKHGAASVNAIHKALPLDGLLYLAIFGSQVKGTERPDSDLDVLFVVRDSESSCYPKVRRVITEAPGGVKKVTIIPHIPESIARMANVYGSVEYGVLREDDARTLYRSADFGVELQRGIDYRYCAQRWLEKAKTYILSNDDWSELTGSWLYNGIDCLLRASLMAIGVKFPYTPDLHMLYDMLPPDRRPSLDLDMLAVVRNKWDCGNDSWSQTDAQAISAMAKSAYSFVAATME